MRRVLVLLEDKVAVVTGGGRGIGRDIAIHLAGAGARVVLAARSVDLMHEVADHIRSEGSDALVVPTDVRKPGAVAELATTVIDHFGTVDVLVNNSGVGGPSAPVWEVEFEDWNETLAVNVTGVFLCCRVFLPGMIERGAGSIINIGSITGKRPLERRSPYAASKMALVGFTRTLAAEAGPFGIRVNLISPGAVEGDRIEWVLQKQADARGITVEIARDEFVSASPLRRLVSSEEVARAAVFLASDDASGITGADLNVTTGMVMY